jgi:hypothetical protein
MAFSLFIHLFVGWVKYITARRDVLRFCCLSGWAATL